MLTHFFFVFRLSFNLIQSIARSEKFSSSSSSIAVSSFSLSLSLAALHSPCGILKRRINGRAIWCTIITHSLLLRVSEWARDIISNDEWWKFYLHCCHRCCSTFWWVRWSKREEQEENYECKSLITRDEMK